MIFFFTGQPGHGKTLHALDRLLEFKDKGRAVYACNVRDLQHAKAGIQPMTPDEFKTWPETLPAGSVVLVDECYEHGMMPKRAPGQKVPHWVEQLAKHRHLGHDFIFVCQSPTKQVDAFVHDLCEQHVHVRRRFGTRFVHLRIFDRFESRPEKSHPLVLKRTTLPKRPMGLYTSTEMDTSEKRVPWYYWAAVVLVLGSLIGAVWSMTRIDAQFDPDALPKGVPRGDGAPATARLGSTEGQSLGTPREYAEFHLPRFATMPWSAPVYDGRNVQADPLLLCMSSSGGGVDAQGEDRGPSCTCLTEQGTRYEIPEPQCRTVARHGMPYNPYRHRPQEQPSGPREVAQADVRRSGASDVPAFAGGSVGTAPRPMVDPSFGKITRATP